MAQINFTGLREYGDALRQLELAFSDDELLLDVVWSGAQPVADEVRRLIEQIPTGELRTTSSGWLYRDGPSPEAKDAMLEGLGIAPPRLTSPGEADTKIGFDGFYGVKTPRHPRGFPIKLEAYSWEHGSSSQAKHPFIRPAVQTTRKKAVEAMDAILRQKIEEKFK